jgi:putative DNA primase/helicase
MRLLQHKKSEYKEVSKMIIDKIKKLGRSFVSRLKTITVKELLDLNLVEPVPLIEPWLPDPGLVMIYAERGLGKTFLSTTVALMLITGESALGWMPSRKASVLYIDGEMTAYNMSSRINKLLGMFSKKVDLNPMKLMSTDFTEGTPINLSNFNDQLELEKELEGIDVIIVDNIATVCRGGRENDSDSWTVVQNWAISQRAKGRSVIFVHHSGKSGAQRGTSAREDILDTVISLKRPKDYRPEQGCVMEIHYEKARHFSGDVAQSIKASLIETDNGLKWEHLPLEESTFEKVIELFKSGITSVTDIANEIEVNKSTVSRHLSKAKQRGLVT